MHNLTDVANTKEILRIIQSVPSPNMELILNMLAEASATDLSRETDPFGMEESTKVAKHGGSVAKAAREQHEKRTGKKIVSPLNAKNLKALNDKDGGEES